MDPGNPAEAVRLNSQHLQLLSSHRPQNLVDGGHLLLALSPIDIYKMNDLLHPCSVSMLLFPFASGFQSETGIFRAHLARSVVPLWYNEELAP